jgi:membrane fusion protein, heavy metal efflux system
MQPGRPIPLLQAAAAIALLVPWLQSCDSNANRAQAAAADSEPAPAATSSVREPPSVELSPSQVAAIRVAPAGMHSFPVEKTEVGSVAFTEDPAIVQAESSLLGTAATLELTRKELKRAQLLYGTEGVSERELEQATSDEQTADAALAAARIALHALGKSDAQIDRMIASGRIDPPRAARSGTRWVEANVFETDIPLIHPPQPVQVAVTAYPRQTFIGTVYRVYATVDPNLHRQTVRCAVADPHHELLPGMLATVAIELRPPLQALAIPADGVVREGDGTLTAWVTSDRRHFTQRVIRTGLRDDGKVQVVDGLRAGELVVIEGAVYLDNMINAAPSD